MTCPVTTSQHSARSALRLHNFTTHTPRSSVQLTSLIQHVFNSLKGGEDLEKLTAAELATKFSAVFENRRFVICFTADRQWSLIQQYNIKTDLNQLQCNFFFIWRNRPTSLPPPSFTRFLDHTQRRTALGRTPLDEWSARRRDLYLTTTHNTHNRQTSMPPVDSNRQSQPSSGRRPTP